MVKIVVAGCLHGELNKMYDDIREVELKYGVKVDIVLCCGDFQAVRNESDLTVMSVPAKYRRMGDFWRYYKGEKKAPYLTVFIGGNHEASNYLQELPYGGWVAPNIYYMGYSGIVNFGGLRIAGLSGIYKRHDFYTGHYEHAPYDDHSRRTAYHIRNVDVFRMRQLQRPVDIVLSHDWPRGIYNYGPLKQLLENKPHFSQEIANNDLGSPAAEEAFLHLRPRFWFSAHLHCKFAAVVNYANKDQQTRFLALDKCLPKRNYLQLVDISPKNAMTTDDAQLQLSLDPEWLCVLRATNHLMSIRRTTNIMPTETDKMQFTPSDADLNELTDLFNGQFSMPDNFEVTAPAYDENGTALNAAAAEAAVGIFVNTQTELLCAMLDLVHPNAEFLGTRLTLDDLHKKIAAAREDQSSSSGSSSDNDINDGVEEKKTDLKNDEEIQLDASSTSDSDDSVVPIYDPNKVNAFAKPADNDNPEEISLDSSSDEEPSESKETPDNPVTVTVQNESLSMNDHQQYDPTDYPVTHKENDDGGYSPAEPFV